MAKKHVCPEPEVDTSGDWMASYGDLVTLLMAFFVMLFAMSTTDAKKFEALIAGLAGPFNNSTQMALIESNPSGSVDVVNPRSPGDPPSKPKDQDEQLKDELKDKSGDSVFEASQQLEVVQEDINQKIEELKKGGLLDNTSSDVRDDARGLVINLSTDDVLFKTGSAILTPRGEQVIAEIAPILMESPNTIVVEGHTDSDKYPSDVYDNWNLAADRAVSVSKALVKNKFPPQRLSATTYGEYRPKVPNDSAKNKSINRRVEILIVSLAQSQAAGEANPVADQRGAGVNNPIGSVIQHENIAPHIEPNINPGVNPNIKN